MKTLRRLGALLLCTALCLGLAACSRDKEDGGVPLTEGPRFTVAVAESPDSLNPVVSAGGLSEELFLLCYDPLWRLDAAGQPQGCLAEDWSLSSDRLTWTVRLRQDAVFSDGTPLTAEDVRFSYDLMRRGDTPYDDYFDGVTAIRCPDEYTVVISTSFVKGDMLYNPTPILPKHLWQDYEFSPETFDNTAMVGSGPFVYVPEESGEEGWLLRSRADHFSGTPVVGEVFFSVYGTVTGAARAISAGEADACFGLSDVQLTTLESVPGVELIQAILPRAECQMVAFNTRSEFFKSEDMRRNMEYILDRDWFLSMAAGGTGMTGSSFMSPGADGFIVPDGLRSFDPNSMAAALRMAGYMDVDDDGVLEYGKRETKLSLTLWTSSRDPWAATAAAILTEDMAELGVIVDWRKTDDPITQVCGDNDGWDMCMYSWRGGSGAAVTAVRYGREIGSLTGWSDENYDAAVTLLCSAEDPDILRGYARQVQQTAYNDCPAAVLAYDADIQAIRSDAWTGYEDKLAGGCLFRTGSAEVYMSLAPRPAETQEP